MTNATMRRLAAAALCAAALGCSSRNAVRFTEQLKQTLHIGARPEGPIQRIEPIWKAAKGRDMKGMPCRGAAGQLLFFAAGSEVPAELKGEGMVAIYVFDDQGPPEERAKPLHKFQFSLGAWRLHLQKDGMLGPSYHVFIPYTRKNVVHQVDMSLVVRLENKEGRLVAMTDPVHLTLPGPKPKDPNRNANLAAPQRSGRTKTTTLDQRFFKGGHDRALRQQARRRGTRVENGWNALGARDPGASETPQQRLQAAREIIEQYRRSQQDRAHVRRSLDDGQEEFPNAGRRSGPSDRDRYAQSRERREEPSDGEQSALPGRSFRLTSATGTGTRSRNTFAAGTHRPRFEREDPFQIDGSSRRAEIRGRRSEGRDRRAGLRPPTSEFREPVRSPRRPHPFAEDGNDWPERSLQPSRHPLETMTEGPRRAERRPADYGDPVERRRSARFLDSPSARDLLETREERFSSSPFGHRRDDDPRRSDRYQPQVDEDGAWGR